MLPCSSFFWPFDVISFFPPSEKSEVRSFCFHVEDIGAPLLKTKEVRSRSLELDVLCHQSARPARAVLTPSEKRFAVVHLQFQHSCQFQHLRGSLPPDNKLIESDHISHLYLLALMLSSVSKRTLLRRLVAIGGTTTTTPRPSSSAVRGSKRSYSSAIASSKRIARNRQESLLQRAQSRWYKSSASPASTAVLDEEDDAVVVETDSHTTSGVPSQLLQDAWKQNLGRGDDTWLHGPRESDWFTGKTPELCPGADAQGTLRSLPLPNLSNVTKTKTLEYFDNSWTLYETLFAGLKGEEPFYRPPVHGKSKYGVFSCLKSSGFCPFSPSSLVTLCRLLTHPLDNSMSTII